MKRTIIILLSIFLLAFGDRLGATEKLSNGLIEVIIHAGKGTYDIIDVRQNQMIISNSMIGFVLKPYLELWEVGTDEVETLQPLSYFNSSSAQNSTKTSSLLKTKFPGGKSLSMITRIEGRGELEVKFTLYPDSIFAEIGFSFRNLGTDAVRLSRIDVLNGRFMPEMNLKHLKTLNGDSGGKETKVLQSAIRKSENNMLCFFSDSRQQRSLVAGGLTYEDYRKYVFVTGDSIMMYADDPVGKRVDAGATYFSNDCFYLNGSEDNPFKALETYAETTRKARNIILNYYSFPSVCMWFLSVTHFGADTTAENSTTGAIAEMQRIAESGFLKYSPVAVRLVPDCYEQNNQQGWWDDEHWQMHGRKYRCTVDHHYKEPYETTKKWAGKIRELGGIPLTYFQPGIRSEDYAAAYPEHMLYNKAQKFVLQDGSIVGDPHSLMGTRGIPDLLNPRQRIPGYGKLWAEAYDYTDTGFLSHWTEVNENLKDGGVQGVFYDYPDRAFPERGGLENRHSTALHAYCNVFRIAREVLGAEANLQERLGIGSDATLAFISSVRTEGDNNVVTPASLTKAATRWYKNRKLVNYDLDGKALVQAGYGTNRYTISPLHRKAILTLSYTVSGRLLLTESFHKFSPEVIFDLSRVYPFHSTTLSARPADAFIKDNPSLLDFGISADWHQLVLYNGEKEPREISVALSGNTAFGALGLEAENSYYLYDFWNDRYVGKFDGNSSLKQTLSAGEARMISVHTVQAYPQWISTDRHIMQGYVDLVKKPEWDSSANTLSGISSLIEGEPYRITFALNGYNPVKENAIGAKAEIFIRVDNPSLADLVLTANENQDVPWKVYFDKKPLKGK
jgi:hypothetical protein